MGADVRRPEFPPAYRIGGPLRWREDEIETYLEQQRVSRVARGNRRKKEAA